MRRLCAQAKQAQLKFKNFSQDDVDRVVAAMADAGFQASEQLGQLAVDETGYGNVADKTKKNQFCSRDLYESIKHLPTVGVVQEDRRNKILEIAEPMGVVAQRPEHDAACEQNGLARNGEILVIDKKQKIRDQGQVKNERNPWDARATAFPSIRWKIISAYPVCC